jgi:hypothetical protein
VNVLLLAVGHQVVLAEDRVALDLVDCWDDTSCLDNCLELRKVLAKQDTVVSPGLETLTCSTVWLDTPTDRAFVLGSLVMAAPHLAF